MLVTAAVVGCGDDDAVSTPDGDVLPPPDAAAPIDGGPISADAQPSCTVSADLGDLGLVTGSARRQTSGMNERVQFIGDLGLAVKPDWLDVQLYSGYGAFKTIPIQPGTYEIVGEETHFESCGVCVLVEGDFVSGAPPTQIYLATSGTVVITEVGPSGAGRFTGFIANVSFVSVEIDNSTGVSTPAGDCTTSVTAASWDEPITMM